jgi:pentatricopeptide repeat protein
MKAAGVTPTGHAFAAAMSACAAGSNWQQAVALFEDMCSAGIKPDVVSCTALISALAAAGQWQRGESVVQWMLSTGVRPNVRTFTALLTALGNARQWDRAFEMLELMQHSSWGGVSPNAYTYSALLKALGECGEWQRAERLFTMLEQEALQQQGAGSNSRQMQAAAWQQQQSGAAATAAAAAAAVAAAAAHAGFESDATPGVWGWQAAGTSEHKSLRPLRSREADGQLPGLGPMADRFGQLALSSSAGWPTADAALSGFRSSLPRDGGRRADASRSSSIAVLASDKDAAAAPEQPDQQQQNSLWMSASHLHGLDLNLQLEAAASQSGSSEGSLGTSRTSSPEPELLARPASSTQLQAQLQSDDAVAAAAAAAGVSSITVAQQLAQLALQQQIAAGMDLQFLMHQQQAQALAASQRVQQQQRQLQQGYPPAPPAGPIRTQRLQQMRQAQQQQQVSDCGRQGAPGVMNVYVVSSLMLAYERAGKWQACVGALARGAALGVVPTASMYTTAISAAGKAGQLAVADALFAQARASGIADNTTYETMVAVLGMAGESGRAEVVTRAMEAAGYTPGPFAYCGLISGYSLSNDPVSAQRVRTRIVRRHGPGSVSVHVYNALLAAADRAGAYDKALELLRCMRREGVEGNALTQQLAAEVGRKGAVEVEGQQLTAAALSAAMAAAGTLLMRSGVF